MNLKEQLEIQALYNASAETPAKPAKVEKPRSTLGPINAVSQKEETQAEAPAPVRRGRPRKGAQ